MEREVEVRDHLQFTVALVARMLASTNSTWKAHPRGLTEIQVVEVGVAGMALQRYR